MAMHEVEEKTRANVRAVITCIRTRHNLNRKDAEYFFQRAINDSEVVERLMEEVDRDVAEQKEDEKQYKQSKKDT
jgi:hypothetical protein